MTATKTETYEYHSLIKPSDDVCNLQLRLQHHSDDAVELELVNLCYEQQCRSQLRKLFTVFSLYAVYGAATTPMLHGSYNALFTAETQLSRNVIVDLAFLLWLLYIVQATFALIRSETLLFCLDFGLQLQTERYWTRRSNLFIPAAHIHDVVINEVIEDLDVHYMLIVRTKGSLFKRTPIITLCTSLRPSIYCLEMIYKQLNKLMRRSACNADAGVHATTFS